MKEVEPKLAGASLTRTAAAACVDLIGKLLTHDPFARLGSEAQAARRRFARTRFSRGRPAQGVPGDGRSRGAPGTKRPRFPGRYPNTRGARASRIFVGVSGYGFGEE